MVSKKIRFVLPVFAFLSLLAGVSSGGDRVGDFALIDHNGSFQHMSWYNDQNAIVIMAYSPGSSDTDTLTALKALEREYSEQKTTFFLINPGLQTDRARISSDLSEQNLDFAVLMDDAQLVSEMLGLTRLGEAVVYDPSSFEISYRGGIESLEAAVERTLNSDTGEFLTTAAAGEPIQYSSIDAHQNLSYETDIAPIIAENCATCHRDGGIAPFAMDSNLAVRGWSPMIREVVLTKRMPPGQIDNKVGHRIKNEMNLSDTEMQKLVHWINNGSQVDSETDPLTALTWPETKWSLAGQIGEPDLIVKVPPQAIPATGVLDYRDIPLDLGLTEDRWVRASEVAPDKKEVLHHIITTVVPPEGRPDPQQMLMSLIDSLPEEKGNAVKAEIFAAIAGGDQGAIGNIIGKVIKENPSIGIGQILGGSNDLPQFAGYAPGNAVSIAPEGAGGLLRAGSSLSLQMHYTTSGKEVSDETEIGIYFYPEGYVPKERMAGGVGNDFDISIPAFAKDHQMEVVTPITEDTDLYSLMPHMHFRGKRMKFMLEYPNGNDELLLSVPDYDFNWQLVHELEEPLRVPAGSQIRAIGSFDNSTQNTANPDPSMDISWGEQSFEEMFMGFYSWKNLDQSGGGD
jgi:peroxiredoxin